MGAPGREGMEGEKMKGSEEAVEVAVESPKDQFAWAQYLHDAQFFDFSAFSPKGLLLTPRDSPGSFPDLGAICASPLYADQLKFLQSWSPTITNSSDPPTEPPPSVAKELQQIQSLHLARVSNSEPGASASVTTSGESEGPTSSSDVKLGTSTAESTGSGDDRTRSRKRKSPEREKAEPENVDDASDPDETEDSKDIADNPSRSKQQKVKGPKRLREPRIAIKTRTEVDVLEDGYKWRKYGQKPVKNSPHPRNYYRCTTVDCPVRKRVERSLEDPGLVVTSYEGTHTHPKVNQLPKRTASGGFAPAEAAESLSESLNQLQNRQQAASTSAAALPQLPNLFPGWPPNPGLTNFQAPSGALQDNVGLVLAFQIVRLQQELQAKMQQFMSYSAQAQGGGNNPFTNPFGFLQGQSLSALDLMGMMSSNSDSGDAEMKFPKVPEALNSGSLLARRAAQRTGSPLNPNLQSSALKMQQLMAQAMAGLQQSALEQQERLGDGQATDQGQ